MAYASSDSLNSALALFMIEMSYFSSLYRGLTDSSTLLFIALAFMVFLLVAFICAPNPTSSQYYRQNTSNYRSTTPNSTHSGGFYDRPTGPSLSIKLRPRTSTNLSFADFKKRRGDSKD